MFSPWFRKERQEDLFEQQICKPVTKEEQNQIISEHKDQRSLGADGINAKLVKNSGNLGKSFLLDTTNEIIESQNA